MERINERMYQANIELVDRNKLLEEDKKILQRKINNAIYLITEGREYKEEDYTTFERELLSILKGSDFSESVND